MGEWGEEAQLSTLYRFGPEPEPVVVTAGTYTGCLRVETKITRTSGRGFHYIEWVRPSCRHGEKYHHQSGERKNC